jgi:hypothetical protein
MKNELLIGICLLAMVIGGLIFFTPGQQGVTTVAEKSTVEQPTLTLTPGSNNVAGRVSQNLALNPSVSMVKESKETKKIMVFKTVPPIVNKEKTLALAKKFNVTGTLRGDTAVQSSDLRYAVQISKRSGSMRYQDQDRPSAQLDAPQTLPTDDEAVKIATQYLKERDLYPEGVIDPVPARENAYTSGKGDEVYYGKIGVWYHRLLNNMKVEGTQLVVYVAGNGDVIGYYANWRDYEPYMEYPVTTPQEAFTNLKNKGVPVGMSDSDAAVSIDNVYLAYQTTPGAHSEDYLKPVWVFKGNVMVDGKSVMPVEQYIPALTAESVKSLSSI